MRGLIQRASSMLFRQAVFFLVRPFYWRNGISLVTIVARGRKVKQGGRVIFETKVWAGDSFHSFLLVAERPFPADRPGPFGWVFSTS